MASSLKDLLLGRISVAPVEATANTFSLLRLSDGTNDQQMVNAAFTSIQAIVGAILALICNMIEPITTVVETIRRAVLENLISALTLIIPQISVLVPQVGVALQVVLLTLDSGNQLLYNGTIIIQEFGCSTIQNVINIVSNTVNNIIGAF